MEDEFSYYRSLLPPALIALVSLLGICVVLGFSRYRAAQVVDVTPPTETPFTYVYLGTEPSISTEIIPETPDPLETDQAVPTENVSYPPPVVTTQPPILLTPPTQRPSINTSTPNSPIATSTNAVPPSRTPTSASTEPLIPGTYDDLDFRLIYTGDWVSQSNVGGAYKETLHISNTIETPPNAVSFRYIGQELRLFFQSAPSLGVITISLDGNATSLDQSKSAGEVVLTAAQPGTHSVIIQHISGGSINLDYVIVPSVPPTATPTSSQTSTPLNQ